MIISHRLNFAFFRIPKTGSITAELMLRLSGAFDSDDIMTANFGLPHIVPAQAVALMQAHVQGMFPGISQARVDAGVVSYAGHLTPQQAIDFGLITIEQLRAYNCYAFLRQPMDRMISSIAHRRGSMSPPEDVIKEVGKMDLVAQRANDGDLLHRSQSSYFQVAGEDVVTPLDFEDFEAQLNALIAEVGGNAFSEIPRINAGKLLRPREQYNDTRIETKVNTHYADDKARYDAMKAR